MWKKNIEYEQRAIHHVPAPLEILKGLSLLDTIVRLAEGCDRKWIENGWQKDQSFYKEISF